MPSNISCLNAQCHVCTQWLRFCPYQLHFLLAFLCGNILESTGIHSLQNLACADRGSDFNYGNTIQESYVHTGSNKHT